MGAHYGREGVGSRGNCSKSSAGGFTKKKRGGDGSDVRGGRKVSGHTHVTIGSCKSERGFHAHIIGIGARAAGEGGFGNCSERSGAFRTAPELPDHTNGSGKGERGFARTYIGSRGVAEGGGGGYCGEMPRRV